MKRFKNKLLWIPALALAAAANTIPAQEDTQEQTQQQTTHRFTGEHGAYVAEQVVTGLSQPAAIEILPDGRALVMQRNLGLMTLVDFKTGEKIEITGMPTMVVYDDAGAHDIELHPDYAENGWIYISYTEGQEVHSTLVLDRVRLNGTVVADRERIFTANAYSENAYHFGGRIQFHDGYVYLSIGDRQHPDRAQELDNHTGTMIRLHDDGRVPEDNPFVVAEEGESLTRLPEIWAYGLRNPQGLYVHPETGELWEDEHGPRGGDELNLIKRGGNYGWPVITFGLEYDGGDVGRGITHQEGMEQPVWVYVPSIAPSDLVIYQGDAFPQWKGNFFIGALALTHLNRLVLKDGMVVAEERLARGVLTRIRTIAVDAAGLIYLGTDLGDIWRLRPE